MLAKFRHDSLVMLHNPILPKGCGQRNEDLMQYSIRNIASNPHLFLRLISFSAAFRQAWQVCLDKARSAHVIVRLNFTQSLGFRGLDRSTAHQHLLHTVAVVCPLCYSYQHPLPSALTWFPPAWRVWTRAEMWCLNQAAADC